jgi:hypothetical protein
MNRRDKMAFLIAAVVVVIGTTVATATAERGLSDEQITMAQAITRSTRTTATPVVASSSTTSTMTTVARPSTRRTFHTFTTPDAKYQMLVPGPMTAATDLGTPGFATTTIDGIRYTFAIWKRPDNVSDLAVLPAFAEQQRVSAGATIRNPRSATATDGSTYDLDLVKGTSVTRYHSKLVGQQIALAQCVGTGTVAQDEGRFDCDMFLDSLTLKK